MPLSPLGDFEKRAECVTHLLGFHKILTKLLIGDQFVLREYCVGLRELN